MSFLMALLCLKLKYKLMKKLLLFTAILVQACLFGQTLPNGSFENWNSVPYYDLNGWNSGNLRDIQRMGIPSVTRVSGFTGYGIRIQTNTTATDTSDSYIINTNDPCSDPPQWTGGVPLTQQPTAITGYYRYNLLGTDTAIFIVIFRKNGAHIGDNLIKIRGTGSQSTFAPFSFSVTCTGTPDSVIFAAAPSNKANNSFANNGSYIELDNLGFAGTAQTMPNSTFENWTAKTSDTPTGWDTWGNGVSKTASSYSGSYAIRLETIDEMCGGVNSSGITNGYLSDNSGPKGGLPYTNTIDTLKGYYKYTSIGLDTANISINLKQNGNYIGGGWKKLVASASYIYFEVPINAFMTPDTMLIDIQSSKWPTQASNAGSVLYLDDLSLKSQPSGVFENSYSTINVHSYPNPAKDVLYIKSETDLSFQSLEVYDAIGKLIKSQEIDEKSNLVKVDISALSSGIYYYGLKTSNRNIIRNKFIIE